MSYDELMEIVGTSSRDDWLRRPGGTFVYKGDLNVRIEDASDSLSSQARESREPWAERMSDTTPLTRVFRIYYGVTPAEEVYAVLINGRTVVPVPKGPEEELAISEWEYNFGKIVEEYPGGTLAGIHSLDAILGRAGIEVEVEKEG